MRPGSRIACSSATAACMCVNCIHEPDKVFAYGSREEPWPAANAALDVLLS